MAIYTTFFLCEPTALAAGFPGWRAPLATPVRREVRNPFTGAMITIESTEPDWPDDGDDGEMAELQYQAIEIEGSHEEYLDGRLPRFVRERPHWATKGLTPVELEPLLELLGISERMEMALYSQPPSANVLEVMPEGFVLQLSSLDVGSIADSWAAELSQPYYTHSGDSTKISEGWTAGVAEGVLRHLVALGSQTTAGQRLYFFNEM